MSLLSVNGKAVQTNDLKTVDLGVGEADPVYWKHNIQGPRGDGGASYSQFGEALSITDELLQAYASARACNSLVSPHRASILPLAYLSGNISCVGAVVLQSCFYSLLLHRPGVEALTATLNILSSMLAWIVQLAPTLPTLGEQPSILRSMFCERWDHVHLSLG